MKTLAQINNVLHFGPPRRREIIPGFLPVGVNVLHAREATILTKAACLVSAMVAAGNTWDDTPISRGGVLYFTDSASRVGKNMIRTAGAVGLDWDRLPIGSTEVEAGVDLGELILGDALMFKDVFDMYPSLIVIDTLASCFGHGIEHSVQTSYRLANFLEGVSQIHQCAVLLLSLVPDGGVLLDRADGIIKVGRAGDTLKATKLRNGVRGKTLPLLPTVGASING